MTSGREPTPGREAAGSTWAPRMVSLLAAGLIRGLRRTIRWRHAGADIVLDLHRARAPYIHAFFHDQLLLMTYSYLGRGHGRSLAVLTSRHRDGEYVARTLARFGHTMVRGSTQRGGASALRAMVRHLREGGDAAFATDGPRGPRHQVQIGVIEAARLGRAVIVPVAFGASKKKPCGRGIASRSPGPGRAASSSTARRSTSRPKRRAISWRPGGAISRQPCCA